MPQSFSGSDEISNLPLSQAQCQQLSAFIKSQVSINQLDSNPQAANVISQPHTKCDASCLSPFQLYQVVFLSLSILPSVDLKRSYLFFKKNQPINFLHS